MEQTVKLIVRYSLNTGNWRMWPESRDPNTSRPYEYILNPCGKTTGLPFLHFHLKFNFSLLVVKLLGDH